MYRNVEIVWSSAGIHIWVCLKRGNPRFHWFFIISPMNWAFGVYIPFADTPLLRLLYDQSHTTETCAYEPGVYFMTCLGNLPFGEGTDISMVQYFLPRWQRFNLYIKYILVGGLEHLDYFSIYIIYIIYIYTYIYIYWECHHPNWL